MLGDRRRRRRVVTGDHRDLEPKRVQRLDCIRSGLFDRIGDCNHRRQAAIDCGVQWALALLTEPPCGRQQARHIQAKVRHKTVRADGNGSASDTGRYPEAWGGIEALDGGDGKVALLGGGNDCFGDRVFGAGLDRRDQCQDFVILKALGGNQIGQLRAAFCQRTGLVDGDNTHIP
ncbi:hypothetical protein D3C72_1551980 [compost metagenome]